MIHYHGTPITPRSELQKLAGKHFCVSFAKIQDAQWCMSHASSVMWDNGAFNFHNGGNAPDWTEYYTWLESRLGHPHWAVIPDVIDGDATEQRALVRQWPHGILGAPVWHMGLAIDYLGELAECWPKICFGSTQAYWQIGSPSWERRCDEAFNFLERRGLRPWIHMLRGLDLAGDRWPFASADSSNVAQNFKRNRICPERMARRIDAIQTPIHWHMKPEQVDMFA